MAVGLRPRTPHAPREDGRHSEGKDARHAKRDEYGHEYEQTRGESGFRVVTWGMAIPHGTIPVGKGTSPAAAWTLYVFHRAGAAPAEVGGLPEISLPAQSRRLVSMRVAGGGSMTTFQGTAPIGGWQRFFDNWFSSHGWTSDRGWPSAGRTGHCRYRPADGQWSASAEVEIAEDGRGGLTGLVMVNPPAMLEKPITKSRKNEKPKEAKEAWEKDP